MREATHLFATPTTSFAEIAKIIDDGQLGIALIVDKEKRLIGIVTDVDIRKGLVQGYTLDEIADKIIIRNPTVAYVGETRKAILARMQQKAIRQVPVLDDDGVVVGVEIIKDLYKSEHTKKNKVVIMAGGTGQRLMPLTNDTPKPLLLIGKRPILGTTLLMIQQYGINEVFVMANYLAEKIENYIQALDIGIHITVIKEQEPMGTCGALSLLPQEKFNEPFIVMNGDVLTNINLSHLLDFHQYLAPAATICIKEQSFGFPYGIIEMQNHYLKRIIEKPKYVRYINTGIYVFDPLVFKYVPDMHFNMPDLCETMMAKGEKICCFPVREFWIDIGQKKDYEKAQSEYHINFE